MPMEVRVLHQIFHQSNFIALTFLSKLFLEKTIKDASNFVNL